MYKCVAITVLLTALVALVVPGTSSAQESILFLSKSVSFAHSPVVEQDGKPSLAETVLRKLAASNDATITCTKDASMINADNLKKYTLVIFYTQGDLTKEGLDKGGVMGPNGVADLTKWIENGGGFLGFHSASDTFHSSGDGSVSPYLQMLGAEFVVHGKQFKGTIKVVDPQHPAVSSFPKDWALNEEWYTFKNFNTSAIHVLAMLDPGEERAKQEMYNTPAYPIVWVRQLGKGRVYFSALGHRDDIWTNEIFQRTVVDAATWAVGQNNLKAEPNYAQVVGESKGKPEEKKVEEKKAEEKK